MIDGSSTSREVRHESMVNALVELTASRPAADSLTLAQYVQDWTAAQAALLDNWSKLGDPYKGVVIERTYDFAQADWSIGGSLPRDTPGYMAIRRLVTTAYDAGDTDLVTLDRRCESTGIAKAKPIVNQRTKDNVADEFRGFNVTDQLWTDRTPEFVGIALSRKAVNNRDALDAASHIDSLTPSEREELLKQITHPDDHRRLRNERHAAILSALVEDLTSTRPSQAFSALLAIANTLAPDQWDRQADPAKMIEARGQVFDALFDFPFADTHDEQYRQQTLRNTLFDVAPSHWVRRATGQDLDLLAQSRGRSVDSVGRDLTRVAFRGEPHSEHVGRLLTQSGYGLGILASSEHVQLCVMALPHLDAERAVELIGTQALSVAETAVQLVSVVAATRVAGNDVAGSAFADYSVTTMKHVAMFGSRVIDLTSGNEGRKRRLRENLSAIVAFADATEALRQATGPAQSVSTHSRLSDEFDYANRNLPSD